MTDIPETVYAKAREALAYALTKQSEGDVEGAVEVIARRMMAPLSEWRPIETAPQKERLLLCDGQRVFEGFWGPSRFNRKTKGYDWAWVDSPGGHDTRATHWMPLPKPPEAS